MSSWEKGNYPPAVEKLIGLANLSDSAEAMDAFVWPGWMWSGLDSFLAPPAPCLKLVACAARRRRKTAKQSLLERKKGTPR